jgi:hypothetical protein
MSKHIKSPFTDEQIEELNKYQHSGKFHPFTCGGNRTDEKHLDGEGILVATKQGWICPYCDYTQDWAHDFMTDKKVIDKSTNYGFTKPINMKKIKTLIADGKTKEQALKQAKHWFKMNPNRWRVNLRLSSKETILVKRNEGI